ncbi:histidine phosphatase superfamily [Lipomyces orientalis]|uniref:Histidine phosphatase superfamily n=1 Tax=Lipomyces orientalis TaxID=1233043 RepID=A0ACC3TIW8_9ASCO
MAPILYLVRHAEGEHNVNDSHHIRDALLTDKGKEQCLQLRDSFPYHNDISLVLASPLRRTIQTASYAFAPVLKKSNVPFLLVPQAQEISALACDVGQERSVLEEELPNLITNKLLDFYSVKVDTTLLEDGWNSKKGIYLPRLHAVQERAAALRLWLWQRPESHIILVTHGAFLHYLTEDWTSYDPNRGTAYRNCEFRRFAFSEASNDQEAHLFEVGGTGVKQSRPLGIETTVLKEIVAVDT